jgi:hypothetical protein
VDRLEVHIATTWRQEQDKKSACDNASCDDEADGFKNFVAVLETGCADSAGDEFARKTILNGGNNAIRRRRAVGACSEFPVWIGGAGN